MSREEFTDTEIKKVIVRYPSHLGTPPIPQMGIIVGKVYAVVRKEYVPRSGCFVYVMNEKGQSHCVFKDHIEIISHTTGYCEQYGITKGSPLGDMVDHLREEHRLKICTDYWITENNLSIIVKPIWADDLSQHWQRWVPKTGICSLRIKERPGKKDKVHTNA